MNNITIPGFGGISPSPANNETASGEKPKKIDLTSLPSGFFPTGPVQSEKEQVQENGDTWLCPACGKKNGSENKFCEDCGTPKPVEAKAEEPADTDSWVCNECGTKNGAENKFCEHCGTTRPKENQETEAPVTAEPAGWTCSVCGAVHDESEAFCTDCGNRRNANEAKNQDNEPENEPEKEPEIKTWTCKCGCVNEISSNFCGICGTRKDEVAAQKDTVSQEKIETPVKAEVPVTPVQNKNSEAPRPQPKPAKSKEQAKSDRSAERQSHLTSLVNQAKAADEGNSALTALMGQAFSGNGTTVNDSDRKDHVEKPAEKPREDIKPVERKKPEEPSKTDRQAQAPEKKSSVKDSRPSKPEPSVIKEEQPQQITKEIVKPKPPVPEDKPKAAEKKPPVALQEPPAPAPVPVKEEAGKDLVNSMGKRLMEYSKRPGRIVEISLASGMYVYFTNTAIEYVSMPQDLRKSHIIPVGPMIEATDQCIVIQNPCITDTPYGVITSEHICNMIDIDNIRDEEVVISYNSIVAITVKRLPQHIIKENDVFELKN